MRFGYYTQGALFRSSKVPFPTRKLPPTGLWDAVKIKKISPVGRGVSVALSVRGGAVPVLRRGGVSYSVGEGRSSYSVWGGEG